MAPVSGWTRRRLLYGLGSLAGTGSLASSSYEDADEDGIPDAAERSEAHADRVRELFGDQFEGLDPSRRDLLVDARYIGSASVHSDTKRHLEKRFRENGIHLQWLDYPESYDAGRFEERFGYQVERILWPHGSFYDHAIEDELTDMAMQVVVVPEDGEDLESVYAVHRGDHYDGVSFGNRCLVTAQRSTEVERILIMHEIGHLALCHNDEPDSPTVMAPAPEEPGFTDAEWERLRGGLDNIRDTTGFDIASRPCMVSEYRDDIVDSLDVE